MNLAVLLLAIIFSTLNILPSLVLFASTPTKYIYVGAPHYWQDYLLYLNQFYQGAHGAWLVANRFTGETTHPSMLYEANLFMGKLTWFLPAPVSYLLWLFILSVVSVYCIYLVIRLGTKSQTLAAIGTFYAVCATSFINHIWVDGKSVWWPFQIWRTPHFAFDRLGGAPHEILQTILYLILTLLVFSPQRSKMRTALAESIVAATLALLNPVHAVFFVLSLWVTANIRKVRLLDALEITGIVGFVSLLVNNTLNSPPNLYSRVWEAGQHTSTDWPFLLASIGPIFIWAAVGGFRAVRTKPTALTIFGITSIVLSYAIFMSPVPRLVGVSDLRFLYPSTYTFLGLFAVYAHTFLVSRVPVRLKPPVSVGLLVLFILLSLPTLWWQIANRLEPPDNDTRLTMTIPKSTFDAMAFLSGKPYNDVVLANPAMHEDSLIPPLSGHTTYSGHMLVTIDNGVKQQKAASFFTLSMPPDEARGFLSASHIRYILFTRSDGNEENFSTYYPFLMVAYKNSDATVYRVPE